MEHQFDLFFFIVAASTIVQIAVAAVSSFITHKTILCKSAWTVVSIAFWLMVIRRFAVAWEIVHGSGHTAYYYWPEIIGFFLSLLLLHGLWTLNKCFTDEWQALNSLAESMPNIVFFKTNENYVTFFNNKWYSYTGLSQGASLGYGWQNMVHPEDLPKIVEYWEMCSSTGCPYEVKCRLRNAKGEYRWQLVRALPLKDNKDKVHLWFGEVVDIDAYLLNKKDMLYGR